MSGSSRPCRARVPARWYRKTPVAGAADGGSAPFYDRKDAAMCGIVGYVGHRPVQELLLDGLHEARVPRLRLGRDLGHRRRPDRLGAGGGQPREPAPCRRRRAGRRRGRRRRRAHRHDRHRPHPLGHPRARQRGQRPPALRHGRSRPRRRQRHRRELHGAQAPPDRHGRGLHVRDRRRGHRPPHRPPLRGGQPRRGRPRGLRRARGPLRVRRDVARRARRPRRRAQGVPADRRSRRGRDLPGLRHSRLPRARRVASSTSRTARSSSCGPAPRRS